jgi:TonB-linked SusC/RagA family outer membrane protein
MQGIATRVLIAFKRRKKKDFSVCSLQMKRVMELVSMIILMASLTVQAKDLKQTITLSYEDAPLETVLKDIEKQTGYTFFYRTNWVKQAKKVTIKASNLNLERALELCFKDQPVVYSVSGKIITISPKTEKVPEEKSKTDRSSSLFIDLKGKIIAESGVPLEGVSVSIKGTDNGTTTDKEGDFFLKNVDVNGVLVVSSVGYDKQQFSIKGKTYIALQLKAAVANLDEVQVIAYGQTTKRLNTGSVSTIKSKDIEKQPVNNVLYALAGRIPGAEIIQQTGLPGSGVRVKIRGQNSILNGNAPLFIIDGVPYPSDNAPSPSDALLGNSYGAGGNPLSLINPNDIESIDVLKDADATAIYGSRGASGVILITTKKGKVGATQLTINAQSGVGKVARKMDLLNTKEYLDLRHEAFKNDGSPIDPNIDYDLTQWDTTRYTDWQKELIGGTSHYNDVQATISGGSQITQFLISSNYHKETTVFPGNSNYQRSSTNFNISNTSANKKLKLSLSGTYSVEDNRLPPDVTGNAFTLAPNAPAMFNSDGSINWEPNASGISTWGTGVTDNPAAKLLSRYRFRTNTLLSNGIISYQIFPGFEIKSNLGYTNIQNNSLLAVPLTSYDPSTWQTIQRHSTFSNNLTSNWIIEPQVTYAKNIFKGEIKTLIGATIQKNSTNSQSFDAIGFNSDQVLDNISSASKVTPYSSSLTYRYSAIFGKINYNWQDRYIFNLTARRDGTSRFGPAERFQNFGAIGVGWMFTHEKFWKLPFVTFGKLRGSFGTSGSDQVGDYSYMDLYNSQIVTAPYMNSIGIQPSRIYTPDLAWEETKKTEVGLELGLLNNKVFLSFDLYQSRSSNQLMDYTLPSITGFTTIKKNLNAKVQNRGFEFELKSQNVSVKNFTWSSSFNLSINRNKLLSAPDQIDPFILNKVGHSLSSDFTYHFLGVDPITGLYQFADSHGAPTSNPNVATDKNFLVDPSNKFYGGLQNSFTYKNFQLDIHFQYVFGQKATIVSSNYIPGFGRYNQPKSVLERWQTPGDVSSVQRISQNFSVLNTYSLFLNSDGAYGDASYIRLRNCSLSWLLPKAVLQKVHLKYAKFYAQGQNLLTLTNYKGVDPETRNTTMLPLLRIVTAGIQLTL